VSVTRFLKVVPRLPVADLSRTTRFYTEVLGFRVGLLWPADAPAFTILERDGLAVQFYSPDGPVAEPAGHGTLNFEVSDVRAIHEALRERVRVEWGPEVYSYGRREFAVKDPDGYLLIFTELTSDPPTCVVD
jgi:catechol 2,3-dioxygenase-like lactoylglutathione lyase family enzyme